ncbi:trypco2 family protein, partial [Streptomyces sp. NPDC051956]|uniref:trypco2 family protein n=1 Tax=Streptomyces sp. NPDC051956 TaxID=3365677 RepID=UPI0037CEFC50
VSGRLPGSVRKKPGGGASGALIMTPTSSRYGGVRMWDGAVGLAEWLTALRAELLQARDLGHGEDIQFHVGPVELELEVASTAESSGTGDLKFWVVGVHGARKQVEGVRHTMKLTLTPETRGGPVKVSDELDRIPH